MAVLGVCSAPIVPSREELEDEPGVKASSPFRSGDAADALRLVVARTARVVTISCSSKPSVKVPREAGRKGPREVGKSERDPSPAASNCGGGVGARRRRSCPLGEC